MPVSPGSAFYLTRLLVFIIKVTSVIKTNTMIKAVIIPENQFKTLIMNLDYFSRYRGRSDQDVQV